MNITMILAAVSLESIPGPIQAKEVIGEGSVKAQFKKTPMMNTKDWYTLSRGVLGPSPGAQPGEGGCRHGPMGPVRLSWKGINGSRGGVMLCESDSSPRQWLLPQAWWLLKLVIGTWNISSLVGREPELVQQVERYW